MTSTSLDQLRAVLVKSFVASTDFHASVRAFRNRLVVTTAMVLFMAVALVVVQAAAPEAHLFTRPPNADGVSRWLLLLLIMLFGSAGALITAIPSLSAIPRINSPYNFPLQQSLVKVAVGTLTALIGVMVLGNAGVAGFSSLQTMLAAAVVFGAGQQAVTRFLDKRAETIVAKMTAP